MTNALKYVCGSHGCGRLDWVCLSQPAADPRPAPRAPPRQLQRATATPCVATVTRRTAPATCVCVCVCVCVCLFLYARERATRTCLWLWGVVTHAQWDQAAGLYVGGRLEHVADGRLPYMSGRDSRETHVNGQHAYMRVANVIGSGAARHQSLGLARGDGAARGPRRATRWRCLWRGMDPQGAGVCVCEQFARKCDIPRCFYLTPCCLSLSTFVTDHGSIAEHTRGTASAPAGCACSSLAHCFVTAHFAHALPFGLRLAHSCGLTCTQGVQFYDTWTKTMLDTITFRGYSAAAGVSVILGMTHIDTFTSQAREMELWCLGHLFLKH